jgi:hypothetical protein
LGVPETNVNGTSNVMEACGKVANVRSLGVAVVVLVGALAACSGEAQPVTTPVLNGSATEEPLPEETISVALTKWLDFRAHLAIYAPEAGDLMTSFGDLDTTDFAGYYAKALELRDWTQSEKTWLKQNSADRCYRSTFVHYSRSVLAFDLAARLMIAGIPDLNVDRINRAAAALLDGNSHINKATRSLPGSQERCEAA